MLNKALGEQWSWIILKTLEDNWKNGIYSKLLYGIQIREVTVLFSIMNNIIF